MEHDGGHDGGQEHASWNDAPGIHAPNPPSFVHTRGSLARGSQREKHGRELLHVLDVGLLLRAILETLEDRGGKSRA